jgi:predicted metal-dependent phosphoesterase TrpH
MIKGDLHIHSNISDCDFTLEKIVEKAKELGISHIAITDHDTILGCERAKEIGKKYGVEVIAGIEISAYDYKRDKKVHILGYGNLGESVKKLCEVPCRARGELSKHLFEIIKNEGYDISWERVESYAGETGVFKQHIMLDLIKQGYTDDIYGDLYKKLFKNNGVAAKYSIKYVDVYEAVKAIKNDGGIAIMAHPAQYGNEDLIEELLEIGLDGIEVYHPKHSNEKIEELLEVAKKNNLLVTGGTDFHGNMDSKYIELGSYFCGKEEIERLIKVISNKN